LVQEEYYLEYRSIVSTIDEELAKLRQVRAMLAKGVNIDGLIAGRVPKKTSKTPRATRRILSPEARARIAAAQKKRWAAAKKATK
jgi:hypothetical protein